MEDNKTGDKKLLVVRSNQRCRDGCNLYQKIKNRIETLVGKLIANEIPEKP